MQFLRKKKLKVHAVCWLVYILLEVVALGLMNKRYSPLSYYLLFYSLNFGLFYFHSLIVMKPLRGEHPQVWRFIPLLCLEILLYLLGSVFISYLLGEEKNIFKKLSLGYYAGMLFRASWFIAYATGYFFLKEYLSKLKKISRKALEISDLKNQLLTLEKDYLRAQISPHLLFNTFSFIKYANKKDPKLASEAVQNLSEIISYALEGGRSDYVLLSREIEQIKKMIRLNQLRFEQDLNLTFHCNTHGKDPLIAPILLLTIVENIFKHGEVTDQSKQSRIELTFDGQQLIFETFNFLGHYPELSNSKSGLRNVDQRLANLYPGKYQFDYYREDERFKTHLLIQIDQN